MEIILSDLVVIWRAWVLFQNQRWVFLIPLILWIVGVGEYTFSGKLFPFAESILSGMIIGDLTWISISKYQDRRNSNVHTLLQSVSLALSIMLNAVTTMMIAYKLWYVPVGRIHQIQGLTMT